MCLEFSLVPPFPPLFGGSGGIFGSMGGGLAVNVKDISGGFLSLNFLK
jgi:hypothetical protein